MAGELTEADQREWAELCALERKLMSAPLAVDVTDRVIDLDGTVAGVREHQDR